MPKVLVVDDESDFRDFIHLRLAAKGHAVIEASNGQAALEVAIKEKPDRILLDIAMPGMGSLSFLSKIKSIAQTADIPVIVLSGHDIPQVISRSMASVAVDFNSNSSHLELAVEKAVGNSPPPTPVQTATGPEDGAPKNSGTLQLQPHDFEGLAREFIADFLAFSSKEEYSNIRDVTLKIRRLDHDDLGRGNYDLNGSAMVLVSGASDFVLRRFNLLVIMHKNNEVVTRQGELLE